MTHSSSYQARAVGANGLIEYTDIDHGTWTLLHKRQRILTEQCAHPLISVALRALSLPDRHVPQCAEVSERLNAMTGWSMAPVPALIDFSTFYGMLAGRCFPAASFIRRREELDYLKEPDIFHEIFGHSPILAIPELAEFSERIGELGVQCPAEWHPWIARLHWFTIEFGLMRHQGERRALGAGLISSASELRYSVRSSQPVVRPFNLLDCLRTPYRIDILQPLYFELEDLRSLGALSNAEIIRSMHQAREMGSHEPLYTPKKRQSVEEPC